MAKNYNVKIKLDDKDNREYEIVDCLRGIFNGIDKSELVGCTISKNGITDADGNAVNLTTTNKEDIQGFNFKLKRIK